MPIAGGGSSSSVISGVSVTGTAAAGQVPVASSAVAGVWAYPAGYEIGYDQITANVPISATVESAGNTVIACAAHTFDGGAVLAHFYSPEIAPGTGGQVIVSLFEAATQIAELVEVIAGTGLANAGETASGFIRFTPSAASHTYTVTAFRITANGTVVAGAGGTATPAPAFMRFTKV